MARSRAACVAVAAALLGSVAWGWVAGGHAAATFTAHVVDVLDGDTIVVRYRDGSYDTVRLLGVDTPETMHPDKPVECYGPEASAYTKRRLTGQDVVLERDAELRDIYGRLLAHVRVDGVSVNEELLRLGYARLLIIAPNGEHGRALLAAELDAQHAQRGLWGKC
ncbi:MAG: thermonuclease family protein [Actinomycetota bacterium]|nr:thermonuclease family protein [Actinomycetota bacterium]